MHSVWLGLIVPSMVFLIWGFPKLRRRLIWLGCVALISLAIAVIVGIDLQQYLAADGVPGESFRRAIYKLITSTDYPLVAILVGSFINLLCCIFIARVSSRDGLDKVSDPELSQSV